MKKEFRKKVISERKNQSPEFISKNSSIITDKLLQMDCIKKAKTIMLYFDFRAYDILLLFFLEEFEYE